MQYAMIAMVFYAMSTICVKLATHSIGPVAVVFLAMVSGMVVTLGTTGVAGTGKLVWAGALLALMSGVFGTIGNLLEVKAMMGASASVTKSVTSFSRVIVLVVEVLVLKGVGLSWTQVGGVLLSTLGLMLMAVR